MTEDELRKGMDDLAQIAKEMSVSMALNQMSQMMSLYHERRDDESLIKMNYFMQILLVKQGLLAIECATHDCTTVLRERELISSIKSIKS